MKKTLSIVVFFCFFIQSGWANDELKLKKIVEVYRLKPCSPPPKGKLYDLGKFLFSNKNLSGNRDTSCTTCHLESKGLSDGIPLAVGVGGSKEGLERLYEGNGTLVQRNAFSLFGRGLPAHKNFFWDAKVDSDSARIFSPFGNRLSEKFLGPLAVAAVLPLTERDEFLGVISPIGGTDLTAAASDQYYQDRYIAVGDAIATRLREDADLKKVTGWEVVTDRDAELADVGNALSDFISHEFACTDSNWEKFLKGEKSALSKDQKRGAILFFGKARCATCHTPPQFSDFKFHGLGIPQGRFGPNTRHRDLGRASVTNQREDLYQFRTPPLIAVSQTAPYGHNGLFPDLESILLHHVNPLEFYKKLPESVQSSDRYLIGKLLAARSKELSYIELDSDQEISQLVKFLGAL